MAFYPSPMGPTESLLELDAWSATRGRQPAAARRWSPTSRRCSSTARAGARDHCLVPIDECYALVGLIRTHWRGLTGGPRSGRRSGGSSRSSTAARGRRAATTEEG